MIKTVKTVPMMPLSNNLFPLIPLAAFLVDVLPVFHTPYVSVF